MPTVASLEDLGVLYKEISRFKKKYPEAGIEIKDILKKYRVLGYRNFCKLFTEEWTPETLVSGKRLEVDKE